MTHYGGRYGACRPASGSGVTRSRTARSPPTSAAATLLRVSRNGRRAQPPPRGGILVGSGRPPAPRLPLLGITHRPADLPLGPDDPAYFPATPHEFWTHIQRAGRGEIRISWRQVTAAELEGWIREAPELGEVLERPVDRQRYDDGGRLAARWILDHLAEQPQDVELADAIWRRVRNSHPELEQLGLSTAQRLWAIGAAQRIFDSHR